MKLLLKIIAGFILLLIVSVAAFVFIVDPNEFKPAIKSAARTQSIDLDIKGDLSWQFWPKIGFVAHSLSVSSVDASNNTIANIGQVSFALAIKPLFSGDFHVQHLSLKNADIKLLIDEQGKSNWDAFIKQNENDKSLQADPKSSSSKPLTLRVDEISISQSTIEYQNVQVGQLTKLSDINVNVSNVNLQGLPISLKFNSTIDHKPSNDAKILTFFIDSTNNLQMSDGLDAITINNSALELQVGSNKNAKMTINYQAYLDNKIADNMVYRGSIDIANFNAREIAKAAGIAFQPSNSNALTNVQFSTQFYGQHNSELNTNENTPSSKLTFEKIRAKIDSTQLDGNLSFTHFNTPFIDVNLTGDTINLDDYTAENKDVEAKPKSQTDTALPLDLLQSINVNMNMLFDTIVFNKAKVENLQFTLLSNDGDIEQNLKADAYNGELTLFSKTKVSNQSMQTNFNAGINKLDTLPLINDLSLSKKIELSGAVNAKLTGSTQGSTLNNLMENMNADAQFTGIQLRLAPINIEQKVCEAISLITQANEKQSWQNFTQLKQFNGEISWRNKVIQLEQFKAGVSQLLLASTGNINLSTNQYEFKLPITFTPKSQTKENTECGFTLSNYWLERGLSLFRCEGNINNIQPLTDCGFDSKGLKALTKDFAEFKLREKHGAKLDAAKKELDEKKRELELKKQQAKAKAQEEIDKEKARVKSKLDEKKDELLKKLFKNIDTPKDAP